MSAFLIAQHMDLQSGAKVGIGHVNGKKIGRISLFFWATRWANFDKSSWTILYLETEEQRVGGKPFKKPSRTRQCCKK